MICEAPKSIFIFLGSNLGIPWGSNWSLLMQSVPMLDFCRCLRTPLQEGGLDSVCIIVWCFCASTVPLLFRISAYVCSFMGRMLLGTWRGSGANCGGMFLLHFQKTREKRIRMYTKHTQNVGVQQMEKQFLGGNVSKRIPNV